MGREVLVWLVDLGGQGCLLLNNRLDALLLTRIAVVASQGAPLLLRVYSRRMERRRRGRGVIGREMMRSRVTAAAAATAI